MEPLVGISSWCAACCLPIDRGFTMDGCRCTSPVFTSEPQKGKAVPPALPPITFTPPKPKPMIRPALLRSIGMFDASRSIENIPVGARIGLGRGMFGTLLEVARNGQFTTATIDIDGRGKTVVPYLSPFKVEVVTSTQCVASSYDQQMNKVSRALAQLEDRAILHGDRGILQYHRPYCDPEF